MDHTECHLQHSLIATRRLSFNQNIEILLDYVLERRNPYTVTVSGPVPLYNFLTKLAVDKEDAVRLLKCFENGERVYRAYKQEAEPRKESKKNQFHHFKEKASQVH
ncbi:hypothetical protein DPMN_185560 [Dreissena polymorpha]|uniref:Uncharacterized protein n=1 Tax=Dreissena polymorpha TaxID=45954 RepID=A0A9D4DKM1_DREPO|nr:hypothetical protein DPMN_185560 [Dreissena polymorpha]